MSLYDLPAKVFSCIRYSKLLICGESNISKGSKCCSHKFHRIMKFDGWRLLKVRSTDSKRLLSDVQVKDQTSLVDFTCSPMIKGEYHKYALMIKQDALTHLESTDVIPLY